MTTYNIWDNRKALQDELGKYPCPYCGVAEWIRYDGARGYGSHASDSEICCTECNFRVGVTALRQHTTVENHYKRLQDYAKGRYAYVIKEHNDKLKLLITYKKLLDKYVGDKDIDT